MSDFKAKMHQIRYQLGPPQTPLGELTRPSFKVRWEVQERVGEEREKRGKGRGREKGVKGDPCVYLKFSL